MSKTTTMRVALIILHIILPVLEYAAERSPDPRDNEIVDDLRNIIELMLSDPDTAAE